VLFPAELVAFTVKEDVPVIVPLPARLKPVGNTPLSIVHVTGVSPVAASVWLYAIPAVPYGNSAVVIARATPPPGLGLGLGLGRLGLLPLSQAAKENPVSYSLLNEEKAHNHTENPLNKHQET
jgi:hypothetical protein